MTKPSMKTVGALRASGYEYKSLRQELKQNLIKHMQAGTDPFPGIRGYEKTVRPQIERAILAGHNILLHFLDFAGRPKQSLHDSWSIYSMITYRLLQEVCLTKIHFCH